MGECARNVSFALWRYTNVQHTRLAELRTGRMVESGIDRKNKLKYQKNLRNKRTLHKSFEDVALSPSEDMSFAFGSPGEPNAMEELILLVNLGFLGSSVRPKQLYQLYNNQQGR